MENNKVSSHLYASNADFIEKLYSEYLQNPTSVDPEWQEYFKNINDSPEVINTAIATNSIDENRESFFGVKESKEVANNGAISAPVTTPVASAPVAKNIANDESIFLGRAAQQLIQAYREHGHININYDPLGLKQAEQYPELQLENYNIPESLHGVEIELNGELGLQKANILELQQNLERIYSSRLGFEYMYIENPEEMQWMQQRIENATCIEISKEEKIKVLKDLIEAETFEQFLHTKFPGTKRFSIEGGEASICVLETIIGESVAFGVREVVIGMAHRGRLNTLTKIMGKPYHAMLSEFRGELAHPDHINIPGDVKYHLGTSSDRKIHGTLVHMSLTPNPSHLEVVNAVVQGRVRAKQDQNEDEKRETVLGVLIHGDAAFSGQGSVAEALSLSQLEGYHSGGTVHVVVNNQIGFTTNPKDSRSTRYCSDIAKMINAPIFHVSGDDMEAVVYASKIASEYRARFKKDVVIDIVCYRKYGHNEGDEPSFTQPLMYRKISEHKNPEKVFAEKLISEEVISEELYNREKQAFKTFLEEEFKKAQNYRPAEADWLEGKWGGFEKASEQREEEKTGVNKETLKDLGFKITKAPEGFNINSKIKRQLDAKSNAILQGSGIDWGTAENLAFASLIYEGFGVRMSGQDVKRGTFSHRHAVWIDQETEEEFIPLNNLFPGQTAKLDIHNSNLSEFAVMAFEYGYSFTEPKKLTIWEGQFGDFANGAQVVIDQYISSGEVKWLRMNGLVLLLPHAYEGQGPEHSSARIERFLQLCANDNMQVANCSTPASYFHILRRQLHRNFRKPLVVFTPKSLLRHPKAISNLEEFGENKTFSPILPEISAQIEPSSTKRLIICSGKVYYDLLERREKEQIHNVAIIRLEQYYPFPESQLAAEINKYSNAEVAWCQEEHQNMGAYFFLKHRIEKIIKSTNRINKNLYYIGRDVAASPAVGYMRLHMIEHEKLLNDAFKFEGWEN